MIDFNRWFQQFTQPDDQMKTGADVPESVMSAGDQKRTKLGLRDSADTIDQNAQSADMLRQPLLPTDPEASTGAPFDPDSGPRESGYVVPADPAQYGAAGDDPGATNPVASGQIVSQPPEITITNGGEPTPSAQYTELPLQRLRPQPVDAQFSNGGDPLTSEGFQEVPVRPMASKQVPVWNDQQEIVGYRQVDEPPSPPQRIHYPNERQLAPERGRDTGVTYGPEQVPAEGPSRWSPEVQASLRGTAANPDIAPYQDDQREPAPSGPVQSVVSSAGRSQFLNEPAANQAVDIYSAIQELPFEAYARARQQLVSDVEARQMAGTDPLAPFRGLGIPLPSAEELNPEGRPASDVAAGLLLQGALPDPSDPVVQTAFLAAGKTLGLTARGLRAGARLAERGAEAAGRAGERVGQALEANAERVAAADARMAQEGGTAANASFGAVPDDEAARAARIAREQRITSDYGRTYPDIRGRVTDTFEQSMGTPSAEMLRDSRMPREVVHPDIRAEGIGPEIRPQVDTSSRLNAGFGVVPDEAPRRAPAAPSGAPALSPEAEAARANLSPVGRRVMEAYDRVTPQRVEAVTDRAIQIAADAIARKIPRHGGMTGSPSDLVAQVHAAVVRNLDDTKVVMTGLNPGALRAFLRGEGLTSKAETGDLALINQITQGQVNVAGGRAKLIDGKKVSVPYTLEDAADFAQRESEQMRGVTGGTRFPDPVTGAIDREAPRVLYAYVSEGQPLVGPNVPTLGLVWKPATPRASSVNHPFGAFSRGQDIHVNMAGGNKALVYDPNAIAGARHAPVSLQGGKLTEVAPGQPTSGELALDWERAGIDIGGGRKIADTNLMVGPDGESAHRASALVSGMSNDIQQAIARGQMTDPEQIAAVLMRGGAPKWKPGWGAVQNSTRTESLILDPDLANVQAIYITGLPKNLERNLAGGGKTGEQITELDMARRIRAAIKSQTGNDVPIIYNDISRQAVSGPNVKAGLGSNEGWAPTLISDARVLEGPPLDLSPGRRRIVDQYTQAIDPSTGRPYMNIGSTMGTLPDSASPDRLAAVNRALGQGVASAVSGGVGAQVNQEMHPDDPNAGIKGFAAGALIPPLAARGGARLARGLGAAEGAEGGSLAIFGAMPGVQKAVQSAQQRQASMAKRGLKTPSAWDWLKQAGYAGIYGPATFTNAAIGGAQELLLGGPKEAVRALVERRPVTTRASARAQVGAAGEGLTGLGRVILGSDASATAAASGGSQGTAGLSDRIVNPVGHFLARALERPGELLTEAPDAVFRPAFRSQGESREASRIAREKGLQGTQATAYTDQLIQDAQTARSGNAPTSPETQRVMKAGEKYADDLGYKGKPGAFGQWLGNMAKRDDAIGVLASFLVPFPGMAARMSTAAVKSTPGAALLPGVRRMYPSKFDMAYDQAFGTVIASGVAAWAFNGGVTGSGPSDPEKRKEMIAQGWQPNSTLVGGYYIPNRAAGRFQPMLDTAGEIHDALVYGKKDQKPSALVADLVKRASKVATDQTGLSGLADLHDMMEDSFASQFPGWAVRSAARYVPYSGILRAAANSLDDKQRKPEGWGDEAVPTTALTQNAEMIVPGMRRRVPAAQDVLGREATNPQQGLGAIIPKTTAQRDDPTIQAFQSANVDIPSPPEKAGDYIMTPSEKRTWNEARGQYVMQHMPPNIQNLLPARRTERLKDLLAMANDAADRAVERNIPLNERSQRRRAAEAAKKAS